MTSRTKRRATARSVEPLTRIGRTGPPIASPVPRPQLGEKLVEYKALDADPQQWFRVMQQADRGDTGPMIDLFSDARDRDSHLDGVVRKRVQSMMGRPIVFRPPDGYEGDDDAQRVASSTRRILLTESLGFRRQLVHLMTGAAYGYSISTIRWATNIRGEHVPHLEWQYAGRFAFTESDRELGFYDGAYRSQASIRKLSDFPDVFVAHVPMGGRSDYPWRRGPMRSCIIPSFIKRGGLRYWLVLAEMFGRPQPYAIIPQGVDNDGNADDTTAAVVREALLGLSQHWAAVFSQGIEIESIPGSGNVSADVHKELIDWSEMTQSIAMLGQNLTTKVEGGAFAAAEAHRYVAADIHLSDSVELAETIAQQVIEPLVRYNWPGAPIPQIEISTGTKQVPGVDDVREGIFSDDERRRMLGHEAKSDGTGAEYRRPLVQVPAQLEQGVDSSAPAGDSESARPQAGEAIEVESVAPDEAVAKDPSSGLNGAQFTAALAAVEKAQLGLLPKATVKQLLLASFPFSEQQVDDMLGPILPQPAAAPSAPEVPA